MLSIDRLKTSVRLLLLLFATRSVISAQQENAGSPSISAGDELQLVKVEGETLEVECSYVQTEGSQTVTLQWKKDGFPVSQDNRTTITDRETTKVGGNQTFYSTLRIDQLTVMDKADYTCGPPNDPLGSDTATVKVLVALTKKLLIEESGKEAALTLVRVNGSLGDLTLTCVGEKRSYPIWQHNGTEVIEAAGTDTAQNTVITLTSDGMNKTNVMRRENITDNALGRYQCVDKAHHQSDSDMLIVKVSAVVSHAVSAALMIMGLLVASLNNSRRQ